MSIDAGADIDRFPPPPLEEPERDMEMEPVGFEPRTEEEYLTRKQDAEHVKAVLTALILIHHHMGRMSEFTRDELDARLPNIPYLDIPDDIKGAVETRRELEKGNRAFEGRVP